MNNAKTIATAILLVSFLAASCASERRVQINSASSLDDTLLPHYLLWMNHKGGVVSLFPSDVGLAKTDASGCGFINPTNPNRRSGIVLALDDSVEKYLIIPFSECGSDVFDVTNSIENAEPKLLVKLDEYFFSCISNSTPDYIELRRKWKTKFGSLIKKQGNSSRVYEFMEN